MALGEDLSHAEYHHAGIGYCATLLALSCILLTLSSCLSSYSFTPLSCFLALCLCPPCSGLFSLPGKPELTFDEAFLAVLEAFPRDL